MDRLIVRGAGDGETERGALSGLAIHPDCAAMGFDEGACDGEAQSGIPFALSGAGA